MKVSRDSYSSYTALAYHARTHAHKHARTEAHTHTHTHTQLSLPVVYAFSFISLFASARHITSLPLVSYIPSPINLSLYFHNLPPRLLFILPLVINTQFSSPFTTQQVLKLTHLQVFIKKPMGWVVGQVEVQFPPRIFRHVR